MLDSLLKSSFIRKRQAKVVMSEWNIMPNPQGVEIMINRFFAIPLRAFEISQSDVRVGVIRIDLQRLLKMIQRFIPPPKLH